MEAARNAIEAQVAALRHLEADLEAARLTQFEATDARRAFPCWDEPDFKAVFATTLVIAPHLTAVSNTAVVSESVESGKKVVRFADSMKMSTYLVAFIVGPLEATAPQMVNGTPVRALCGKVWVPGRDPGKFPVCPECREIFEGLPPGGDGDD